MDIELSTLKRELRQLRIQLYRLSPHTVVLSTVPVIGTVLCGLTVIGYVGVMRYCGLQYGLGCTLQKRFVPIYSWSVHGSIGLFLVSMTTIYRSLTDWTQPDLVEPVRLRIKQLDNVELRTAWKSWYSNYRRSHLAMRGAVYGGLISLGGLCGLMTVPYHSYWWLNLNPNCWEPTVGRIVRGSKWLAVPCLITLGCSIGYGVYRSIRGQTDQINRLNTVVQLADTL